MARPRPSDPPAPAPTWPCLRGHGPQECRLSVSVVPNASRTEAVGLHDGALRLRLAAPPVDGKANDALVAWVAAQLDLPRRAVQLARGPASRQKQLEIGAPEAVVAAWLRTALAAAEDGPGGGLKGPGPRGR